jgi:hypothetical protein
VGISGDDPTGVAGADLPDRVAAAQYDVDALAASVTVVEHGWHPDVPERRLTGSLGYRAPETLVLHLEDQTSYPDDQWRANDVDLVVDDDIWWARGPRDCPSTSLPDCTPTEPAVRVVTGREPFAPAAPAPLDVVMPVESFALSGAVVELPATDVGDRATLGIATDAAQAAPLLAAYRAAGNLRMVHPTDPVELRLDEETLVPLQVVVRAADGPDRGRWAEAQGYTDTPGDAVLSVTLTDVVVGPAPTPEVPPVPSGGSRFELGFVDGPVTEAEVPTPEARPAGLEPHRTGTVEAAEGAPVAIRAWTDGRAWLTVSATGDWRGQRLFGDLGTVIREVDLGAAGVAYRSEDGRRIGLHGERLDVVVAGSVTAAELRDVAASLGVVGRAVPGDWAEAATADLATARAAIEPLLLPGDLSGFAAPAFRVDGPAVTASFAGPGTRAFALVQTPAFKLTPPLESSDVVAVVVRGVPGRFSPSRGDLEWFADDIVYRLHSTSLSRNELVAIAEGLEPA